MIPDVTPYRMHDRLRYWKENIFYIEIANELLAGENQSLVKTLEIHEDKKDRLQDSLSLAFRETNEHEHKQSGRPPQKKGGGSEETKSNVDLFLKQEVKMNIEENDTNIVHRYGEL